MKADRADPAAAAGGFHRWARTLLFVLGALALLLALSGGEYRGRLLVAGCVLLVAGGLARPLLRYYGNIAIVCLNTLLLLMFIEFAATAVLAAVNIPYVRTLLADVMGRPGKVVDHYLSLPYYADQEWSEDYWQEHLQALRKDYYPYVIWRSPMYSGELLNVGKGGIRRTPGAECSAAAFRVHVLGGSTVWGWGAPDWGTIPAYLQARLSARQQRPVCVVNYGENAFVSTQDLVQLITLLERGDVADMVIFYGGANDVLAASQNGEPVVHQNFDEIAALFEDPGHPLVTWIGELEASELLRQVIRQAGLSTAAPVDEPDTTPGQLADAVVQSYFNTYRMAGALAQVYGFEYLFFLQPYITAGSKPLTTEEQKLLTGLNWVLDLNPALVELFAETYRQLDSLAGQHEHLVSLSGVFDETESQVWLDTWGHVTPAGNERIAEAMLKVIKTR